MDRVTTPIETMNTVAAPPHADTIAWLAARPDFLDAYAGRWVAFDRRIVADDPSPIEVVRRARAAGYDDPLLVPTPPAGAILG